jgi:AcrR family transcriptional regulator
MATRTYTQTARAEATARTRRAILDAVQRVVLEEGRYDLPLDAVAEEAGVSTRTVLRHFGSREELVEAGIADADSAVRRERAPAPGDAATNVRRIVDHYERVGDAVLRMLGAADRYPLVRRITDEGTALHRDWVRQSFAPDLEDLGPAERERRAALLATVTDIEVWALLRRRHGFSRSQVEAAMRGLVDHARGALP